MFRLWLCSKDTVSEESFTLLDEESITLHELRLNSRKINKVGLEQNKIDFFSFFSKFVIQVPESGQKSFGLLSRERRSNRLEIMFQVYSKIVFIMNSQRVLGPSESSMAATFVIEMQQFNAWPE